MASVIFLDAFDQSTQFVHLLYEIQIFVQRQIAHQFVLPVPDLPEGIRVIAATAGD